MKLKIRNSLLLVLHTLAFGLLFFPISIPMYNFDLGWTTLQYGNEVVRNIRPLSFLNLIDSFEITSWSQALAIVVVILFFVVFIALSLQLIGKNDQQQNSIFTLILSIINLFSFFWYSFFLMKAPLRNEHYSLELGDLFIVELLLLVISVVFYVITYVTCKRNSLSS